MELRTILFSLAFLFFNLSHLPAQQSIRVGLIVPLTGARASIGEDAVDGANLALETIALRTSTGRKISAVVEDSRGDPAQGVAAFQKLRSQGIEIFITQNSNISLPISHLARQQQVLQLAINTTSDAYSTANDFTFRTNGSTLDEAQKLSDFVSRAIGRHAGTIGIVSMQDEYPQALTEHVVSLLATSHIKPALQIQLLPQESDFRAIISRLKQARISYVLCLGYQLQCGQFIRQQAELKLGARFIIGNTPLLNREFFESAGPAAEGVIIVHPMPEQNSAVATAFQKRFTRSLNFFSANAFDAIMLLDEAARDCSEPRPYCLGSKLQQIKNFPGASGQKSFDEVYGDMQDSYQFMKAANGHFIPFELEAAF